MNKTPENGKAVSQFSATQPQVNCCIGGSCLRYEGMCQFLKVLVGHEARSRKSVVWIPRKGIARLLEHPDCWGCRGHNGERSNFRRDRNTTVFSFCSLVDFFEFQKPYFRRKDVSSSSQGVCSREEYEDHDLNSGSRLRPHCLRVLKSVGDCSQKPIKCPASLTPKLSGCPQM